MRADASTASEHKSVAVDVVGAAALVLYSITASVSFAALVFTGAAADGLPRGVTTFLLASGVLTVLLGLRTGFPLAFGVVQDTAAIVLVPAVVVIVDNGSDDPVRDLFVVLALSSLLTGAAMWVIGRARLGGASRFMPTTVVAGFLAGTGWLLAKGGFDVMTSRSLGLGDVDDLFSSDLLRFWLPGAALGLVIAVVPFVSRLSPIVSGFATVVGTGLFFVIVGAASSLDAIEQDGWLLGPFPAGGSVRPVGGELADADWSAIAAAGGQIGVVVILSMLGVLLNISGIQSLLGCRVDLDAELRTAGLSNILVAPLGGLVGYHGLGDSALAHRLGVTRRWVAVVVGALTGLVAFVGGEVLGYIPKFVAGGLLVGAGVGLLADWFRALRPTAWPDRVVSIVILASIAFVGILEGIVIGIIAACLIFVLRYSRVDPVRLITTGADRRSVVERSPAQEATLDEYGGRAVLYELQGYLFFGSVSGVADRVRARIADGDVPVDVVILDFERVTGIDSSAFAALAELAEDVADAGGRCVCSSMGDAATSTLRSAVTADQAVFPRNRDAALESAEELLLVEHERESPTLTVDSVVDFSAALVSYFERVWLLEGDTVMEERAKSDTLAVVVSGSVSVARTNGVDDETRLRRLRAGALLGEIGFLTDQPRTATVRAATDVELLVLDRAAHDRLRSERPDLALELYDRVLRGTAHRAKAISDSLTEALR